MSGAGSVSPSPVLGRIAELARIDGWLRLEPGPAGHDELTAADTALVIEGEPGIGKTTLWREAVRGAGRLGWQVLSCRPVPSEAGLPYVALADLLRTVPDAAFERLPPPQRRGLRVALLREEAGEGELSQHIVGLGLTTLLGEVAGTGPVLLAVDDAQWLDPASVRALAFALRRLTGQPLAVLAAVRVDEPGGHDAQDAAADSRDAAARALLGDRDWQRLAVGPLTVAAVHHMFRQALGSSFPRPLLVSIHRSAGGNPFYALEIARELRRAGVPAPGQPLPIPGDHRELALLRMRRLPRATRDTLAALAAMPAATTGDLDTAALAAAERAGIVAIRPDWRVAFTHPLFGSALYSSLPEAERRRLHRELAARATGPGERARHLALAADGPDADTAAELDNAAAAARARGAADAAVELKELACRLTPAADGQDRIRRGTELADFRYFAGDPTGARRELESLLATLPATAGTGGTESEGTAGPAADERAEVLLELGSMVWIQGEAEAGRALMTEALGAARTPALRARIHARMASGADDADVTVEHGEAALALLDEHEQPQIYSHVLHLVALFRLYAGRGADHGAIEKGMRLQRGAAGWDVSPVAAFWARNFDDFATARTRFEQLIQVFREQGDEAQLCAALAHLTAVEAMTGHTDRARELVAEALDLAGQTEQQAYRDMALCALGQVCALTGDLAAARQAAGELLGRLEKQPDLVLEVQARQVLGLAALTAGDLASADRELSRADEIEEIVHNREPANQRFQADHAEAVIGLGDTERGEALVRRLEDRAAALPRPWIRAVAARSRGLLNAAAGDLDAALADYHRALAAHETLDMPGELGRTLLALGRLHRRRNERQQAGAHLTRAVEVLDAAGAAGWAAVARQELERASGRRGSPGQLTPTEQKICELAAAGLRNHEIAARLFLSAKTVEANLSHVYRKLGIRSRTEIAAALARTVQPGQPGRTPEAPRTGR